MFHDFAGCVLSGMNIIQSAIYMHSQYLGMQSVQRDHMLFKLQFLLLLYKTGS